MKTTERILQIIKRDGATTAKQLSAELQMTTMGARQHLQNLEDEGILAFHDVKVKVGRPTRHWSLTRQGHARFADRHSELSIQVIDAVEVLFGKEGLEKVAAEREQRTLHHYQQAITHCDNVADILSTIVALRKEEGYMAELEQRDDHFVLVENHCPICSAATHCPVLCQSELNIFRTLLAQHCNVERTEHIVQGERRCSYLITLL